MIWLFVLFVLELVFGVFTLSRPDLAYTVDRALSVRSHVVRLSFGDVAMW